MVPTVEVPGYELGNFIAARLQIRILGPNSQARTSTWAVRKTRGTQRRTPSIAAFERFARF